MSEGWADVWVFLEKEGEALAKESLELLAAGRGVADKVGQKLVGLLLGHDLGDAPEAAIRYGADSVICVDSDRLTDRLSLRYIDILSRLATERRPFALIFVANEVGKEMAARLAYRLKTGLATDNIELQVGDFFNPRLNQTYKDLMIQVRPDFGTRVAKIYTPRHRPQMATVRPGNFKPLPEDRVRRGKVEAYPYDWAEADYRAIVRGIAELPPPRVDMAGAQVVIGLGLGILRDGKGNPRNPREAYDMAARLKDTIRRLYGLTAEIGASRALIYAELKELEGLLTVENQVGQTGVTVSPDVYIALGISGAVQHRVGMQKSKKIVAVNTDPSAPIFQIAHYPVLQDLYEFLPEVLKRLESGGSLA